MCTLSLLAHPPDLCSGRRRHLCEPRLDLLASLCEQLPERAIISVRVRLARARERFAVQLHGLNGDRDAVGEGHERREDLRGAGRGGVREGVREEVREGSRKGVRAGCWRGGGRGLWAWLG